MAALNFKLNAHLNAYLRERMDFIASLSTLDPTWTVALDVIEDLIEPVWGEEDGKCPKLFLLLDNIARSEKIRAGGLKLTVEIINNEGTERHEYSFGKEGDDQLYRGADTREMSTNRVGIYMGATGLHAFFAFIENFIRNSAKHSKFDKIEQVRRRSEAVIALAADKSNSQLKAKVAEALPLNIIIQFIYDWVGERRISDDYVKVIILDNMGGWPKPNEKIKRQINESINPVTGGWLLSREGQLAEGGWGLKELRICTSFLRGLRISNYERTELNPPVLTPEEVPYCNTSSDLSLGYQFFLPKVKDLLMIGDLLPKTIDPAQLRRHGMYKLRTVDELRSLQHERTFTHSFVAIDVEEGENFNHFFHPEHVKQFPLKTILVVSNIKKARAKMDAYLSQFQIDNTHYKLLYESLKSQMVPRAEFKQWFLEGALRLGIEGESSELNHFEGPERAMLEVYGFWISKLNRGLTLPKVAISWWGFLDGARSDKISLAVGKGVSVLSGKVVLSHKGEMPEGQRKRDCRFYAPFTHGRSDRVTFTKKELLGQTDILDHYWVKRVRTYLELLEAALTNIIVIDERIFLEAYERRKFCGQETYLFNHLYLQNIVVLNISEREKLHHYNSLSDSKTEASLEPGAIPFGNLEKDLEKALPHHFKGNVHFLIIHQTIIDTKLNDPEGVSVEAREGGLERFFRLLGPDYQPSWVIVTTGRGKPESIKLPPFSRFMEFSNIRKYLVEKPDKILLTQMLYSIKEG